MGVSKPTAATQALIEINKKLLVELEECHRVIVTQAKEILELKKPRKER